LYGVKERYIISRIARGGCRDTHTHARYYRLPYLYIVRALTSCLVVIIPVPPKISPFTADRDLHLGERTTLTCSVTRGDLPLSITWLKDGRSMGPSERVTVTNMDQYSSILMIESLSPDHNGNYSCVARNVAAEVSHTQRLVVHGNPPLGPLQFARRPPDRPSFACACVRPLRACEPLPAGLGNESRRWKLHVEICVVAINNCYIPAPQNPL
jgi:hypothetical protein